MGGSIASRSLLPSRSRGPGEAAVGGDDDSSIIRARRQGHLVQANMEVGRRLEDECVALWRGALFHYEVRTGTAL